MLNGPTPDAQALEAMLELAKRRGHAEAKVWMVIRIKGSGGPVAIATRELAEAADLSLSSVVRALKSLDGEDLIRRTGGGPRGPTTYEVVFPAWLVPLKPVPVLGTPVVEFGAVAVEKLGNLHLFQERSVPVLDTAVCLFQERSVPVLGTPPNGVSATCEPGIKERARAPVDSIEEDLKPDIDRLPKPSSTKYDADLLRTAQSALHSYMLKFGPDPNAKPPDVNITAQFLDAGPWPDLAGLLLELHAERKKLYSYGYLVTTAHQRLRNLTPEQEKERRAAQRKPNEREATRELAREMRTQMRTGALGKHMGYTR